jgi:hypothetical protein
MGNLLILTQILGTLLDRADQIQAVLAKAHSEGRDVTAEELDTLFATDAAARTQLQAAIDAAKAGS